MRLLVAAQWLGGIGGMERFIDVVLPALAARGVEVRVIARKIDRAPEGIQAELVAWSDEHDAPDAAAHNATHRAIEDFAPHAALAENVMDAGVVEALRAAPRLVYHVHDHRPFCPNGDRVFPRSGHNCTAPMGAACVLHALIDGCGYGPRPKTLALIARREALRDAIASADAVAVASRYVADRATSNGIARKQIATVPNPLPDEAYADATALPAERSIVFVGRLVPQKGLLSLLRALGGIDAARRPHLRVFGDGPDRDRAGRLAAELGVELDLEGGVDIAAVRSGIDRARIVVVPSLWAEPFGIVGTEALARGRPVIAYDAGGVDAWLRDGENGIAVPLGNERGLGEAIADLLDDAVRCERMAEGARASAELFRLEPCLEKLLATLQGT